MKSYQYAIRRAYFIICTLVSISPIRVRYFGYLLVAIPFALISSYSTSHAESSFEGYYMYLYDNGGDHPTLANPGWHEEAQGITHDNNYWYITNNESSRDPQIWKIPVTQDLAASLVPGVGGVERISFWDTPAFSNEYYDHLGDLSYFNYNGTGYLLIALENYPYDSCPPCHDPAIAVFNADTLQFIAYQKLLSQWNGPYVAVDTQGTLYCSDGDHVTAIRRYEIDWALLSTNGLLSITELTPLNIYNENGQVLTLGSLQGGVVSPSGNLLYLVGKDQNNGNAQGIQVIEIATGRRVMYSTNGSGHFNFHFDPDGWPDDMEEPEGLTIWDLDGGGAPGILGQLHVIMLDNDWPSSDEVTLEHYTNKIIIDGSYQGPGDSNKNGSPAYPFKTISDAYLISWDGAKFIINSGSYNEALTSSKKQQWSMEGQQPAIIGE